MSTEGKEGEGILQQVLNESGVWGCWEKKEIQQ